MILRDLEQKIVKVINESGLPIDAIYFIMKSLMAEIEQKYDANKLNKDMKVNQNQQAKQISNKNK